MASRGRKLRAGLFGIAALALLVLAVLAFGGLRVLRPGEAYFVEYEGTVYGLEDGANVYMNGVRVGTVDRIEVSPDHPGRVRVRIVVAPGTPVRADTRAMLQFTGITGLKVIDLREGTPAAPPLPPGSMIAAGETTIDKLERRAAELSDQAVALLERANQVLDTANQALANVAAVTDPGGELIQKARRGAADLAAAGATLRAIATENRAAIRRSLGAIDRAVQGADDVVAQLRGVIRDNGAALRAMMSDLRQASRSLKELAREVRQRPSRLLYSEAPRERRLP